jgi:hypothetical protein
MAAGARPLGASPIEPGPPSDRATTPHLTLSWSTATEADVYGFLVLRAETEGGPFQPVTEEAIPGAGNSDVRRHYRFDDARVERGRTYFYALESVSLSGERRRLGPVVSKRCCDTPAPAAQEGANGRPTTAAEAGEEPRPIAATQDDSHRPPLRDVSREKE